MLKSCEDETPATKEPKEADWRFGPAQLWYDMLGISHLGEEFDYGFKLKPDPSADQAKTGPEQQSQAYEYPDDAFSMVTQYNWEDDIIWNADDPKHKLGNKRKNNAAGLRFLPSFLCIISL